MQGVKFLLFILNPCLNLGSPLGVQMMWATFSGKFSCKKYISVFHVVLG